MKAKDIILIIIGIIAITFGVLWATQTPEVINYNEDKINKLEAREDSILSLYNNILIQKDSLQKLSKLQDSIIQQKDSDWFKLKRRHNEELEKFKTIPVDSAFMRWVDKSRTR